MPDNALIFQNHKAGKQEIQDKTTEKYLRTAGNIQLIK
jgi:hypothetical protein